MLQENTNSMTCGRKRQRIEETEEKEKHEYRFMAGRLLGADG